MTEKKILLAFITLVKYSSKHYHGNVTVQLIETVMSKPPNTSQGKFVFISVTGLSG